jgi:hypothetical protein
VGREFTLRIFDGGRTRSKIEVQDTIQEQALIAYEGALLEALEDVENAMRDFAEAPISPTIVDAIYISIAKASAALFFLSS